MDNSEYKFIHKFRIDNLYFELFRHPSGKFKTTITDPGYGTTEQEYTDLEQLVECLEDDLSDVEVEKWVTKNS
tara:strand:- start:25390 stop:25608 length:219 start_codon:yes stop_codon:yes gene_type:complete